MSLTGAKPTQITPESHFLVIPGVFLYFFAPGVSAVAACIGAFFVARRWLEQFAEKGSLNPLYFIGGALLVLAIVLGVVVLNCLRIARANPVESLKNE